MSKKTQVQGFKFAARTSGIKASGKPDLGLIYSEVPAHCAGVFTTNKVVAAPVVVSAPRVRRGTCQAVLINSGNANACTGDRGLKDALRCGELAAGALGIGEDAVAVSSTGIIGEPLPMEKFERHVPALAGDLHPEGVEKLAEAIMTTDAFPKVAVRTGSVAGREYRVVGVAKGAGMIHPDMATMLAFVMTDASVTPEALEPALRRGVDRSFNCITVDRDTSTNDMVLVLANGLAGNPEIEPESEAAESFGALLESVMLELAKMIVRDGEGATKVVKIRVRGARDEQDARKAARSIATSTLVKTAFFGEDANWGRIIAAAGYSGAEVDPERVAIRFGDYPVVENGLGLGEEARQRAAAVLRESEFTVTVDFRLGEGEAFYYTSDLTYDYVRINADYHT